MKCDTCVHADKFPVCEDCSKYEKFMDVLRRKHDKQLSVCI